MDRLVVLGTGVANVTKYENTCFLLDNDKEYFLVDGTDGNGILRQFDNMNLDWAKLRNAFVSHCHTGHLLGMIWVIRCIAAKILKSEYAGNFVLYGCKEVLEATKIICELCLQPKEYDLINHRIMLNSVKDGETLSISTYNITFFDILSEKATQFGFSLTNELGKKVVFLGDEPLSSAGETYLEKADWMLSEAFCLHSEREIYNPFQYHHSTVKETSVFAMKHQVKNLILWHTEDTTTFARRKELYKKESKQFYDGNIWGPDDGDVIIISD